MFKNYFKIAFRNLWRNKAFSAINIFGLAVGIATCLLILLFLAHELSYDRYNKNADRIVRVVFKGTVRGDAMREANVMPPVAQALKAEFPEVQEATRLRRYGYQKVIIGEKSFSDAFAFADPDFFKVFTLPFIEGDPNTALSAPNTIVITKAMAQKYFGQESAIGKILKLKDLGGQPYRVTGVMRDIPATSHFHFDLFASMSSLDDSRSTSWITSEYYTYLLLPKGYDYRKLEPKIKQVADRNFDAQLPKAMGLTLAEFRAKGNDIGLFLQPLTSIHLHSDLMFELDAPGNIQYIYIFSAIAIFMLLIACINFTNLSTAGAFRRSREVGIRKVMGAEKRSLIWQFLLESFVLTGFAMLLGLVLVQIALPLFNQLANKHLQLSFGEHPLLIPGLLLFGLFTGLLAGSYPAFFLSSFKPIAVLKGKLAAVNKRFNLRSGLVIFQFAISATLILGTLVIYRQLSYIHHKALGFNKDQVLVIPNTYHLGSHQDAFRQQLLQDPRVVNASLSGYLPAGPSNYNNFTVSPDSASQQITKTLRYDVDYQYIPTLGMQMASGRNFSPEYGTDSTAVILNETAAHQFGWDLQAQGHTLTAKDGDQHRIYHVIGVVKDFHFKSLHERISPLVMVLGRNEGGPIIIKTTGKDPLGLVATAEKRWTSYVPDEPFQYAFMDDLFNNTYETEKKTGDILGIFALITILVACLGLFGLAMFTATQRTKEISIRKVLGASTAGIVGLLSRDFLRLVLIANLVAWPLAWWMMNKWLQDFAYRIQIQWWMFVITGVIAVLIALATISVQAVKAALAKPVNSLKAE
ncbi:ABC transporter permease [Chitinophaga vietnamensis]|uniref:ABC transporter permease n=1 Tax=Chitinophaga vietnamensis TaxID=2593957 RepID=UPI001178A09B|nr:ABC transporter permease [Chitinophaga vietnamensis]